jgi:hypothetical protein
MKRKKKIQKNKNYYLVFISILLVKLWKNTKNKFKKIKISLTLKDFLILFLLATIIYKMYSPEVNINQQKNRNKHFSIIKQLEKAKIAHSYYTKALSKEELLVKWIELYSSVKYKLNGDIKYKKADCTSAVFLFLKSYGYQGDILNVNSLNKKIKTLRRANLIKVRKKYKEIQLGDLITFRKNKNGIPHIGIIYEKRNGYICYVDMNASIGMGISRVKYGAYRINKITEISFTLWSGNLLQEFDPVVPAVEEKEVKEILKN